jgi:hypothetical protein
MTGEQARRMYIFIGKELLGHQKVCVFCQYGHWCKEWDRILAIKRQWDVRLSDIQLKERGLV